jgi:hypothetical protein
MNKQIRMKNFKTQRRKKKKKKVQINKILQQKHLVRKNIVKRKTRVLVKKSNNLNQQILKYEVRNPWKKLIIVIVPLQSKQKQSFGKTVHHAGQ